jgi:hypothetical protein
MRKSNRNIQSGDICLHPWSDSIYQELGTTGLSSLADGQTDGGIYLLGWPSNETGILQGEPIHTSTGSNLRLFVPAYNEGINTDNKVARMIEKVVTSPLCTQLVARLRGLTAKQVLHYLEYTFKADRHLIIVNGLHTMPQQLAKDLPGIEMLYAHEVYPLKFWGGPPTKMHWYEGTLLTFLADKILTAWAKGDKGLLARFLNVQL